MAWTGVNMSTPLCPEGVPEIDADLPSLDTGCVKGIGTDYPQTLPRLGGDALPHTPPILSTPLCWTWRRLWVYPHKGSTPTEGR